MKSYLGFPEQALLKASYNAAFFWTYIVEQFGTPTSGVETGMSAMVDYWEQNEVNDGANDAKDGIGTLNDMLATMGTSRRFEDIFQDFAVANYLKDYINNPAPAGLEKYNYVDEENYTLNGNTFGSVKLTRNQVLMPDQPIFGTTSLQDWGARYFQIDPDPAVPTVNIEVEALVGTPHPLYYKVVLIDNGNIVGQYDDVGTSLQYSIDNTPDYDRIALIVASMDDPVNFTYGFNLTDGIFILAPTTSVPASVGELTSPEKFILQLVVLDEVGDPVGGIATSEFEITVGSTVISPTSIIGSSYIGGQYWITLRAPSDPGNCTTLCDLSVDYAAYGDLKEDAILYGPKPDTDNMIIIDRSGSMAGNKIEAAKNAAVLYVDSYDTGDRIGVTSYNDQHKNEFTLTGWTNTTRQQAQDAIKNLAIPDGATAIGAALRDGMNRLIALGSPNPVWSMVLLSDGQDTVADTDDHISAFIGEYNARKD
ncbi:MAG: VWA domain-containing protein, partial [Caldilineaceae bacterium]|nr:VWA domain-containing protein [Caldilineaceae bacterium]